MIKYLLDLCLATPFNVIALILRYLNIFFIVGLPLVINKESQYTEILPLVGVGGMSFLIIGGISEAIRRNLLLYYYLSSLLFLILLFVGYFLNTKAQWEILTAVAFTLGFATANTETRCLFSSVTHSAVEQKATSLQIYNSLKVLGICLGFIVAALLSGGAFSVRFAVITTCLFLLWLLMMVFTAMYSQRKATLLNTVDLLKLHFRLPLRRLAQLSLFVIDVALFTFWYVYLPKKMLSQGFSGWEISTFLAVQALSHVAMQSVWKRLIFKFGALKSFLFSFIAHLSIVFFIGSVQFSFLVGCLLFFVMGLINSGTFLASSLLYYGEGKKSLGDNYFHLGASHTGKWLGVSI